MALRTNIRWRLINPEDTPPPMRRTRRPVTDQQSLSKLLGLIDQSRIPNNLNQIARANHEPRQQKEQQLALELARHRGYEKAGEYGEGAGYGNRPVRHDPR